MIDLETATDQPPVWFIPSFWGDIRLTPAGDDDQQTQVVAAKLTTEERSALQALSVAARAKGWLPEELAADAIIGEGTTLINAPIKRVAGVIAKVLKPRRRLVSAIIYTDGHVEEIRNLTADPLPVARALSAPESVTPDEVLPAKPRRPKAAATVGSPTLGCPAPDFAAAEVRARQALIAFLTPDQIADFRRYNRFVSTGQSGRRYMVTSRHAKGELAQWTRSLFDLEEQQPLCVHDWDVPAAEEMLSIHLLLQLPGWELYLRKLEGEDGLELHADAQRHQVEVMGALMTPRAAPPPGARMIAAGDHTRMYYPGNLPGEGLLYVVEDAFGRPLH